MTKIALRNAWFQVHKWIGLILAVLIIPLSVTGALLVWDEAVDHALNPGRYATSGSGSVGSARYVAAARAVLKPGETISALTLPEHGEPAIVTASRAAPTGARPPAGPPARKTIYLDPPTARVLAVANGGSGILRTAHIIHGSLLVPGVGRQIVGWIGVAMLLSSATGLWLWWPTVGRWTRGLRWKRRRGVDANLHHMLGFWIALPLFVLSLTGVWIAFPQVFGGGQGGARGGGRPATLATPRLDLDTVVASAQAKVAGDVSRVEWPTDKAPVWKVTVKGQAVSVAEDTGAATLARPERETLARTMRRIHDGTRMGMLWQIVIFLGGLIPAILAVTGIIMWWRARGWRAQLAARSLVATP